MSIYNGEKIVIVQKTETHNTRFNAKTVNYTVRMKEKNNGAATSVDTNANQWLRESFQEILDFGFRNTKPHYYVGIKINVPDARNAKPIGLSYRPINSISSEILTDLMENVIQSNDVFDISEQLEISLQVIEVPSGGSFVHLNSLSEENVLKHKKKSILTPNGHYNDSKCLPRALILGKAFSDNDSDEQLNKYLRVNSKILKTKTNLLIKNAGVTVDNQIGCILNDVYKFQKVLKKYQIIIYDNFNNPSSLMYKSSTMKKVINLFYLRKSEHFIVIKSVRTFFGFRYRCEFCEKMMQFKNKHHCKNICKYCRKYPACPFTNTMIQCSQCNRVFKGEICFKKHMQKDKGNKEMITNVCSTYQICNKCFKFLKIDGRKNEHICSDKWCPVCEATVSADHMCYIQSYKKDPPKKWGIIFFDIEARQEQVFNTNKMTGVNEYLHEANLCIASQVGILFAISFLAHSLLYTFYLLGVS